MNKFTFIFISIFCFSTARADMNGAEAAAAAVIVSSLGLTVVGVNQTAASALQDLQRIRQTQEPLWERSFRREGNAQIPPSVNRLIDSGALIRVQVTETVEQQRQKGFDRLKILAGEIDELQRAITDLKAGPRTSQYQTKLDALSAGLLTKFSDRDLINKNIERAAPRTHTTLFDPATPVTKAQIKRILELYAKEGSIRVEAADTNAIKTFTSLLKQSPGARRGIGFLIAGTTTFAISAAVYNSVGSHESSPTKVIAPKLPVQ